MSKKRKTEDEDPPLSGELLKHLTIEVEVLEGLIWRKFIASLPTDLLAMLTTHEELEQHLRSLHLGDASVTYTALVATIGRAQVALTVGVDFK